MRFSGINASSGDSIQITQYLYSNCNRVLKEIPAISELEEIQSPYSQASKPKHKDLNIYTKDIPITNLSF